MADPFTALMYAVQVMNFLKVLIERTLKGREDSTMDPTSDYDLGHFDENGRESPSEPHMRDDSKDDEETEQPPFAEEPIPLLSDDDISSVAQVTFSQSGPLEQLFLHTDETRTVMQADHFIPEREPERFYSLDGTREGEERSRLFLDELNKVTFDESPQKMTWHNQPLDELHTTMEKSQVISNLSRIESRMARLEAWR